MWGRWLLSLEASFFFIWVLLLLCLNGHSWYLLGLLGAKYVFEVRSLLEPFPRNGWSSNISSRNLSWWLPLVHLALILGHDQDAFCQGQFPFIQAHLVWSRPPPLSLARGDFLGFRPVYLDLPSHTCYSLVWTIIKEICY